MGGFSSINGKFGSSTGGQPDPTKTQLGKVGTTQPVTPTLPVIPDPVAGSSQMDPRFGPMPFSNPFGGFGGFGGLGFGMNPFNQMANSAFNRFGGFQGGNPFIQQFNPRPNPFAIDTQQPGFGGNGKFGSFPPIGLGFENGLNPIPISSWKPPIYSQNRGFPSPGGFQVPDNSNAGFGFNFFGTPPQNPVPQPQIPKQQIK